MHPVQAHRLNIERYYTPASVEEAVRLLDSERVRLIAGGTDLLLEMQRGIQPGVDTLVDLTRIPGLADIDFDGETFRLGCLVTHNQVVASDLLVKEALPLAQACFEVGSPQLRNRATLVGNLVTASPANDTITPLRALDAKLELTSAAGVRQVTLAEFHTGVRKTVLRPGEMITAISFAAMGRQRRGVFVKLGLRRAQAISVVHATVLLGFDQDVVNESRILLGSVAPTIVSATAAESSLIGQPLSSEAIAQAAALAAGSVKPIDDIRATASYRARQVEVVIARALNSLAAGTERATWPTRPVTLSVNSEMRPAQELVADREDLITAEVNGRILEAPGISKTLLDWLRDDAGPTSGVALTGTKEGCAEGECGACTVFIDGMAVMACLVPAAAANSCKVVTIEGLATDDRLHPLQQAFVDKAAVQCGYCIPGFLMAGAKLLEEIPKPTTDQILTGLSGNLCRCTGYYPILTAVAEALS